MRNHDDKNLNFLVNLKRRQHLFYFNIMFLLHPHCVLCYCQQSQTILGELLHVLTLMLLSGGSVCFANIEVRLTSNKMSAGLFSALLRFSCLD